MNNKGFTLIELLVTIVLLALVATMATYSVTGIINSSKNKNYEILVKNIKSAAEIYYQEKKDDADYSAEPTIGYLAEKGYLVGNNVGEEESSYIVKNPKTNKSMNNCRIEIIYIDNKLSFNSISTDNADCPKNEDLS